MANKSIALGGALIIVGVLVTILSSSGSITSMIPAIIGILFVGLGWFAQRSPDMSHHLMHGAAALALLAILASLGSAIGRSASGWALFSQLATIVLCAGFLVLAVQSFKAARANRT